MQKIYTLLRDNKQSGPYTLDEMVQLKPRPFDLVWVEGKSAGWSYPSEIDSLKSFVTETVKADNDPVPTRQTSTENGGVPSKVKAETKYRHLLKRKTSQRLAMNLTRSTAAHSRT